MSGAFGSGSWGSGSWGGGSGTGSGFGVLDAQPIRENVVRVEFSEAVYFTGLLDASDASIVDKWSVEADSSSIGMSGDPARAVRVVKVELAGEDDGVDPTVDYGRFVNLILDRPMTPFPATYAVSWEDIFSDTLADQSDGTLELFSAYREIEPPRVDQGRPSRDFANPQTIAAARTRIQAPWKEGTLGAFGVGDDGDYATDEGNESLKKRVLRRLATRKGAFLHLPTYGVGVPDEAKKLGTSATLARLSKDAELQIKEEPDVAKVRVVPFLDPNRPGLAIFRIAVKPSSGPTVQFDVPFRIAS